MHERVSGPPSMLSMHGQVPSLPLLDVLIQEIAELQPLPNTAAQVMAIAESAHFSAPELAQAISSDPALTARVLRLANSPYYGYARQIETPRDAIVLLGFREVRSVALAASTIEAFADSTHLDPQAFWRHSMFVALLAESLAKAQGIDRQTAFTAGVLQNLGRLALDQTLPDEFGRVLAYARTDHVSFAEACSTVLGFSDAELGGGLAREWGFPADLVEAIEHAADDPVELPEGSLVRLIAGARQQAAVIGICDGTLGDEEQWPGNIAPLLPGIDLRAVLGRADAFLEHTAPAA